MLPVEIDFTLQNKLSLLGLGALVVSTCVSLTLLWSWWRAPVGGWQTQLRLNSWPFGLIAISLTSIHLLLWHLHLSGFLQHRLDLVAYWASLVAVIALWTWTRAIIRKYDRPAAMLDLGSSVLQTAGLAICLQYFASAVPQQQLPADPPGHLVACTNHAAHTDRGEPITLFCRNLTEEDFSSFVRLSRRQIAELAKHAMLKSDPQSQTNCHGWVFTGGLYWINNDDVDTILSENGYSQAAAPQLQDLVIYRDSNGAVIHTGFVCGFLGEEGALVESKWGIDGVYVHKVDQQPYSQNYQYWRSEERAPGHHQLQMVAMDGSRVSPSDHRAEKGREVQLKRSSFVEFITQPFSLFGKLISNALATN